MTNFFSSGEYEWNTQSNLIKSCQFTLSDDKCNDNNNNKIIISLNYSATATTTCFFFIIIRILYCFYELINQKFMGKLITLLLMLGSLNALLLLNMTKNWS